MPGWSVYTAAKAGVAKFSHGLYTELRPFGMRVTCLTPPWGQTAFNQAVNITGVSENPELALKCTRPEELGVLVREILETPDHLAIPDLTIQPMVQDICPMGGVCRTFQNEPGERSCVIFFLNRRLEPTWNQDRAGAGNNAHVRRSP